MCRLYALHANEPTKVECTLVHAQNALMRQSEADMAGYSHAHGWGIAAYEDHLPVIERQAWAAYHGAHFKNTAARIYAYTVLAHIRRATVGPPIKENTHPFAEGTWTFIHNGTLPAFSRIQTRMRDEIALHHLEKIEGTTDSEHLFRLFLTLVERDPKANINTVLAKALHKVLDWSSGEELQGKPGLNVIITDGERLVASRWGRGLYYVKRRGLYDCEICGFPHVRHKRGREYKGLVIASEPITHEDWVEIPERSVVQVTEDFDVRLESI